MDGDKEVTTKEVIDNWNRVKYPSFQDYMNSEEIYFLIIDQNDEGAWKVKIKYPDGTLIDSQNVYTDVELNEEYDLRLEDSFRRLTGFDWKCE